MIIGGFKLVTNGESSRHGDVSRELAVLEPPGDWAAAAAATAATAVDGLVAAKVVTAELSADEIIRDNPRADADLTTERDRCCCCFRSPLPIAGIAFSDEDVPVSGLGEQRWLAININYTIGNRIELFQKI